MSAAGTEHGLVVVTGTSRGIGAAVAVLAARRAHPVVVNYAGDAEAAYRLAREIADGGGWAQAAAPTCLIPAPRCRT